MQMKADKSEIEKLYEVKTSKIEFENVLDIQQIMSKQFRHIVILFIEIVSCWTHKINDTKQSVQKRTQNLIRQLNSFSNWVMEFDPINCMNSSDAANIQIMDKLEEAQFKDFTNSVLKDLKE